METRIKYKYTDLLKHIPKASRKFLETISISVFEGDQLKTIQELIRQRDLILWFDEYEPDPNAPKIIIKKKRK